MNYDVGDSGSLYIYWSTNGPADSDLYGGAFIDIVSSDSGVIEFTAAETLDYAITKSGEYFTSRMFGDPACDQGFVGPAESVTADFINELGAFNAVCAPGIAEANNGSGVLLDEGYSAVSDGFHWGRIDFNVIGKGATSITGIPGDFGIVLHNGQKIDAAFNTATINVGVAVPDPTSACLLAVGLLAMSVRRSHRASGHPD